MVLLLLALPLLVLLTLPAPISAFDWSLETAIGTSIERRHQLDMPVSTAPPMQASTSCFGWAPHLGVGCLVPSGGRDPCLSFTHSMTLRFNLITGVCSSSHISSAQLSLGSFVCLLPLSV